MEDKKKKHLKKESEDTKMIKSEDKKLLEEDIDDLIFAEESVKLHSEK